MKTLKVATIVGARPQFIKAAPVSRALRQAGHQEFLIHTGQHYDYEMSRIFFQELGVPEPDVNLEVGSGSHGWQTGQMLMRIEDTLLAQRPAWVIVHGDTNSTLAGALAACKLRIPLAHVEAGLRSFNRDMPEEHNRVLTDQVSDLLFCPTKTAVANLEREGITAGVHLVGDVMYDSLLYNLVLARNRSRILNELQLDTKGYILATVHRSENTDDSQRLAAIFRALEEVAESRFPLILPLHPRTRNRLKTLDLSTNNIRLIQPVSYLEMLLLEENAHVILTDSGGVQKEAYWLGVPCVTLRSETEWVETVESGWNFLAGTDAARIADAVNNIRPGASRNAYGDGKAAERIVECLAAS